jgi:PIN domain nuclease of toxin-antitoxin system
LNLLLDTHILLWAALTPERISGGGRNLLEDRENQLFYSAASFFEIEIKRSLGRSDFLIEPSVLQRGLSDNGYSELSISVAHALTLASLPPLHRDPFDRILVAQAMVEGMTLITSDPVVARYQGPVRKV